MSQDRNFKCSKCKKSKSYSEFYLSNGKPNSWCKECFKQDHRQKFTPISGYSDEPRNCLQCDKRYSPGQRRKSIFCSRNCKDGYKNQKQKTQLTNSKQVRICVACKKTIPKTARSDKKYCSEDCSSKMRGTTMNVERRIRTSEPILHFKRIDIYERDNWTCQICMQSVNPELAFPNPMCASLDHVIPLSRGGSHKTSNVQLAHLRCNTSRGNKVEGLSPRPALVIGKQQVFTVTEAALIVGVTSSILQTAVIKKKVPSIQKSKFGTRYLTRDIVDLLILSGVPGSFEWRRNNARTKPQAVRVLVCKKCNRKILVNRGVKSARKYCSEKCYTEQRNFERRLNPSRLEQIYCDVCSKHIKGRTQKKRINLCSASCVNERRRQLASNKK